MGKLSSVPFDHLIKARDEDTAQEMRLQLLTHRPETKQEAIILLRKVADAARWKYNRDIALQTHLANEPAAEDMELSAKAHFGPVWDFVQTLPKLQCQLLIAVHVRAIPIAEISQFLHITRPTTYKWLQQAEDAVKHHFTNKP